MEDVDGDECSGWNKNHTETLNPDMIRQPTPGAGKIMTSTSTPSPSTITNVVTRPIDGGGDDGELSTEEFFIITDSIRTLWNSLSPPTSLGYSGTVTPNAFLRLMWRLDVATTNDVVGSTTLRQWKTTLDTLTSSVDAATRTSITHPQFEHFMWKFARTIQPTTEYVAGDGIE